MMFPLSRQLCLSFVFHGTVEEDGLDTPSVIPLARVVFDLDDLALNGELLRDPSQVLMAAIFARFLHQALNHHGTDLEIGTPERTRTSNNLILNQTRLPIAPRGHLVFVYNRASIYTRLNVQFPNNRCVRSTFAQTN